jgi:hypothetical protein
MSNSLSVHKKNFAAVVREKMATCPRIQMIKLICVVLFGFMIHVKSFRFSSQPFQKASFFGKMAAVTRTNLASTQRPSDFRISEPPEQGSEKDMHAATEEEIEKMVREKGTNALREAAVREVDAILVKQHLEHGHEIYKKYPFFKLELPMLDDRDNYYSGSFKGKFWHQNADQVYLYMPVDDKLKTSEVKVQFETKKASITIKDVPYLTLDLFDSIIPGGSFWVFERDQYGVKYLLLDMEKRYRMINWNSLLDGIVDQQEATNALLMNRLIQTEQFEKLQTQPIDEDIFQSDPYNGVEHLHEIENPVVMEREDIENMEFENPEQSLNPDGDVDEQSTQDEQIETRNTESSNIIDVDATVVEQSS